MRTFMKIEVTPELRRYLDWKRSRAGEAFDEATELGILIAMGIVYDRDYQRHRMIHEARPFTFSEGTTV